MAIALVWAFAPAHAQQGTLLLSELLFQPRSGEAEYVELYNAGNDTVQLAGFHIVRVLHDSLTTHYPLPSLLLAPHAYVALSKDIGSVSACYPLAPGALLLECQLPTYPNDGGSAVLARADSTVVDRFDYSPALHSRLLRNKAGVSLERRRFDRPTNEASNWFSASSTSGYGTPGAANSQSTEWLAEESAFELSASLVSPDGDGYQDELEIGYRLDDGDLAARIEVFDAHGQRVRRLLNNALLGTHGSLVWDGRGENGSRLPHGQYVLLIILYDTSGTRQTIRRAVAVVG
ncbi:MAG: lamin tail domain-containing protein [Bacteroidales bacterium]|nr:lamin tail domain-containing protein [Bacteroidales bacterium]